MIGSLGNQIVFTVSAGQVRTFSGLTRETAGRWASHEAMGTKPRAEFLGPDCQKVTMDIQLSASLGVRPRRVLETIEAMVESGAAEYLIIGSRPVGRNPFRITGSSESWDTVYSGGELARAKVTLTLEEYM